MIATGSLRATKGLFIYYLSYSVFLKCHVFLACLVCLVCLICLLCLFCVKVLFSQLSLIICVNQCQNLLFCLYHNICFFSLVVLTKKHDCKLMLINTFNLIEIYKEGLKKLTVGNIPYARELMSILVQKFQLAFT